MQPLVAVVAYLTGPNVVSGSNSVDAAMGAVIWSLIVLALLRFGLLATAIGSFTSDTLLRFPLTFDLSAWYSPAALLALIFVLSLAVYGFAVSFPRAGSRPAA